MLFRTSDVKKYLQCPRLFILARQNKKKNFPIIYFNESLVNAALKYLDISSDDIYVGNTNETSFDTLKGMEDKTWLMSGRFEKHDFRSKISFLKKEEGGYVYYALCRTNFPRESEARRLYMDKWLLETHDLVIKHVCLIHLDAHYERNGDLDYSQLFKISDCFFKDVDKPGKNVDEVLNNMNIDMPSILEAMQALALIGDVEPNLTLECTKNGKCEHYYSCFNEDDLEDNSIVFLNGTRKKYEMFKNGKKYMHEVNFDDEIEGSYIQWAQYQSSLHNKDFIDKNGLSYWLTTYLKRPLIYIDFEWDTIGIPMYDKMKPYDVLVFEYSMDYERADLSIVHREYLGDGGDCREAFIKQFIKDCPKEGTIVAYNGDGAEVPRLRELAKQFPIYEEELKAIWERVVDLTYPIMQGIVYMLKLRGTLSLKRILEVLEPVHSYHNLEVSHGLEAVEVYRSLNGLNEEDAAKMRQELFKYCGMDTYSMIVFVRYLYAQIG